MKNFDEECESREKIKTLSEKNRTVFTLQDPCAIIMNIKQKNTNFNSTNHLHPVLLKALYNFPGLRVALEPSESTLTFLVASSI